MKKSVQANQNEKKETNREGPALPHVHSVKQLCLKGKNKLVIEEIQIPFYQVDH